MHVINDHSHRAYVKQSMNTTILLNDTSSRGVMFCHIFRDCVETHPWEVRGLLQELSCYSVLSQIQCGQTQHHICKSKHFGGYKVTNSYIGNMCHSNQTYIKRFKFNGRGYRCPMSPSTNFGSPIRRMLM